MSSAAQPAKFSASLCHRGHGAPQRPQQGLGTVRGPAGWGDRDFRQSLLGLAPPLRVVQARGLLGHTSQGGYAVAGGSAVSAGTHRQYPARRSGANEILGFASALSGVVAAGSSDGGGGWEMAADGVFVKEIKQTLQLADFLGHNANAVRWQVWTALLTYVLLRFCAWISRWGHSFTRLFTLLRSALWIKLDLRSFLESYGTAEGSFRFLGAPEQAYLPGIP